MLVATMLAGFTVRSSSSFEASRSAALTDTFMSAYATSSPDGTKWQDVAHTGSLSTLSMDNTVCCVSNAYP